MKKLDFLVGRWEGDGWMMQGPGARKVYRGGEHIQRKLQGKAILVEGLFIDPESKKPIHETMAVITYDVAAKKYNFDTYLFNRPNGHFELKVEGKGFTWQMAPGGGVTIDYTMTLTDKGEWHEVGEAIVPGRGKSKFLEMTLKKVG